MWRRNKPVDGSSAIKFRAALEAVSPTIVVNVVKRLARDYYHTISGERHINSEPCPLRHRDFSSIPALDEFQWSCLSEASKLRISDALSHDLVNPCPLRVKSGS
jgi:hypothetical protein